ncbi:AbrB/MazE/SpoVT family DNA-binding domain-containing protein [Patescibacteria group bacterium]|nr:AbrB/MazE/SpoVT family DNA-binding domain-containing protein [Patescibacteria group bacterium]
MKIGIIVTPNEKGQVVIPKKIREELGIKATTPLNLLVSSGGVFLSPISQVFSDLEQENSYPELLEKTKGSWSGENFKFVKERRKLELKTAEKGKKEW